MKSSARRAHPIPAHKKSRAVQTVHFVGIGGAGMSALAKYVLSDGCIVSGSDMSSSGGIEELRSAGAAIVTGEHRASSVPRGTARVIISNAIDDDNPELRAARRRGVPVERYAEAVGKITRRYRTIAVCGAHGKSTTAALAARVMEEAGLDPTVIVGTRLHEWKGQNFRRGEGGYLVLEADEYRRAFLKYAPAVVIATNIDREHLDYFSSLGDIKKAFFSFFAKVPSGGVLILNKDDDALRDIGKQLSKKRRVIWYSLKSPSAGNISGMLKIPGRHNVSNACAVLALAKHLSIPDETVFDVFRSYRGSWRRSEYKGVFSGAHVFDDYAHHPTEIRATLSGFRERYPDSRIWCVFQPHQQKRLDVLFNEFVGAFHAADRVVLLDTYCVPGRDGSSAAHSQHSPPNGRDADTTVFDLATALDASAKKNVFFVRYASRVPEFLRDNILSGDIVVMMGAGDINAVTQKLFV